MLISDNVLQDQHPIKTYVRRQSRMTDIQKEAIKKLWPLYGLELSSTLLDFQKLFKRDTSKILEIGFGMGHSLLAMAKQFPESDFIGIEVHLPGIGALLAEIEKQSLNNIRIFNEDALLVLKQCIPDASLDKILIFFPDPWPKRRHHKRRLIQNETIKLIQQKLKSGGILHLATDWEDYALQMMKIISTESSLINLAGEGKFSLRPAWRSLTKFEMRGEKLGYTIYDLIFKKTVSAHN